ncbi:hypothetical protein [Blastococcus saxobsidens]|uniref:Uncharacterized protein n=1 Tax=Blastococcus saxobsidens TaxID=138336 RepID=A0A4Q7Y2B8_9ACTN|nr:hypothetical protein [Blastococcus saxobsidens]RZU30942.1 hypothetical protein BKA19_0578 [Blastococcus saxobsidens]
MDSTVVAATVGALIGAALPVLLGLWKTRDDARVQRNEELRRRRTEVYMAFCGAALDYRRAALNQWDVRARLGGKEAAARTEPAVGEDVRATRATAWSRYYEVFMLSSDGLAAAAHACLQGAADISGATTKQGREALGTEIHDRIRSFAEMAARYVGTPRQELPERSPDASSRQAGSAA